MMNSFKRCFASGKHSLTIRIELVERTEVKSNPPKTPLDKKQAETLRSTEDWHTDTDVGGVVRD